MLSTSNIIELYDKQDYDTIIINLKIKNGFLEKNLKKYYNTQFLHLIFNYFRIPCTVQLSCR